MLVHGLSLAQAERTVMEDCIRRGKPPPDAIQNAPVLNQGLALYYDAFMHLHSCRQLGEVMGPISWLAIDRYCERNDITGEQYEDMQYYVSKMDAAYLEHHRTKVKALQDKSMREAKAAAKKNNRRGPVRRGK